EPAREGARASGPARTLDVARVGHQRAARARFGARHAASCAGRLRRHAVGRAACVLCRRASLDLRRHEDHPACAVVTRTARHVKLQRPERNLMRSALMAGAAVALASFLQSFPAHAEPADYVYSPTVEYGEREIDFKYGSTKSRDGTRASAGSVGFGLG